MDLFRRCQHDNRAGILAEWEATHDEDGNPLEGRFTSDPVGDVAIEDDPVVGDEPHLLVGACPG